MKLFDCSDRPTALVPDAENPETGNFRIEPLRPISEIPVMETNDPTIEEEPPPTVAPNRNGLLELLPDGEIKEAIEEAYYFMYEHEADSTRIVNKLFCLEYNGLPLELTEVLSVFALFFRNVLSIYLNSFKKSVLSYDSEHKLVRMVENSLMKIVDGPSAGDIDRDKMIGRLEEILAPLKAFKVSKKDQEIYQSFLHSI